MNRRLEEPEDWRGFELRAAQIAKSWADVLHVGHDIRPFNFATGRDDAARLVAEQSGDWLPALYVIHLPEGSGEAAAEEFKSKVFQPGTRSRREGLPALPRISTQPPISDCLYVGKVRGRWDTKSKFTVRQWLRQHLAWGDEPTCRKTSSCRLQMWLPDECWPVRVPARCSSPGPERNECFLD